MAIDNVRRQVRDYVPVEMLTGFEQLASTTDALWKRLDKEADTCVA